MFCQICLVREYYDIKIAQTYLPDPIRIAPEALSGNGKIVYGMHKHLRPVQYGFTITRGPHRGSNARVGKIV